MTTTTQLTETTPRPRKAGEAARRRRLLADRLQALQLSALPPARTPQEQEFRDTLGAGEGVKARIQRGSRFLAFAAACRLTRFGRGEGRARLQEAAAGWLLGDLDYRLLVDGQSVPPEPPGPHLADALAALDRAERLLLRLCARHAARTDAGEAVVIGKRRATARLPHWDKKRGRRKRRRPLQ